MIKTGAGIVSHKMFKGYVDPVKKTPQNVHFKWGFLHIKDSEKKIGKSYKLQSCLLRQELDYDEIYYDIWEE